MTPSDKAWQVKDALIDTIERVDGDTYQWLEIIDAALREAENAAYEKAAQVATIEIEKANKGCDPHFACDPEPIAAAIRALKAESK